MELNKLEAAILEAFTVRNPDEAGALKSQIKDIVVSKRENSGAGFFTYLLPAHRELTVVNRVFGKMFADVEGLTNSMTFLLFTEDGAITMLEGAAIAEDTTNIDFAAVSFKILPLS